MRVIRFLLNLIRIAIYGAAGLVLLVAVAGLVLMKWPQLLINERNLHRAAEYASRKGIVDVRWSTAALEVRSSTLLRKNLDFAFKDLCVRLQSDELSACFSEVSFAVAVRFSGLLPEVVQAGPVTLKGGDVSADLRNSKKSEQLEAPRDPAPAGDPRWLPGWLRKTRFGPLLIQIDRAVIREEDYRYLASGELRGEGVGSDLRLGGQVEGVVFTEDGKTKRMGASLRFEAQSEPDADGIPERLRATIQSATLERVMPEIPSIRLSDCIVSSVRSTVREEKTPNRAATVAIDCPVKATIPVPPSRFADFKIPSVLGARIRAELGTAAFPIGLDQRLSGVVSVHLDPVLTPVFEGHGTISTHVSGMPAKIPEGWELDSRVALEVSLPRFKRFERAVRKAGVDWAVPAPLHVLDGPVELRVEGRGDLTGGTFPVFAKTRLRSKNQRLDLDASGLMHVRSLDDAPSVDAQVDLRLSQVRLELPRLELATPPRIAPDPRIKPFTPEKPREEEKKDAPSRLDFELVVRTVDEPVKILSNLAQAPVPVRMHLKIDDEKPPTGTVRIDRFPLELFRRDARLNFFDISLSRPTSESPIRGEAQVRYADYTIFIRLVGTAGHPRVALCSDPPLPEDQLFAVLLFGRPLEELDPGESQSVGSARVALTEGAMNLALLYILASTPVESVAYDPTTGVLRAKVRIAEGTSLNVGTGAGTLQDVGIRKRLGKHWTITTEVGPSFRAVGNPTVTAFLEWINRY